MGATNAMPVLVGYFGTPCPNGSGTHLLAVRASGPAAESVTMPGHYGPQTPTKSCPTCWPFKEHSDD